MSQYRAIATVYDPWGKPLAVGGETVFKADKAPVFSGLLDADGAPIYRFPEIHPLGFDTSVKEQT